MHEEVDVSFYKGDTVYYLDHEQKRAFIGTVLRSDKLVPDSEPEAAKETESDAQLVDSSHDTKQLPDGSTDQQECSPKETPQIKVTWSNLLTGDDYFSPSENPIPTCLRRDQISLIERDHMLNDTVRHAKRNTVGTIVNIRSRACGEVLSYGRILLDLDCRRLRSVYVSFC
ncbi:hypothetical protein D915_007680 [Fasciola hepatica]|uniref:Uncharacterized protein n=1 Tax=Fasciola hepatica TaxID=6192 RepID=A0A4E0R4Y2_FASHE|nr:hypothetical protein D915_007680 [Fasciola hepatica]